MNKLTISFIDEIREISAGEELIFGRGAQLDIDENPFLHRQLGVFRFVDDLWWLSNLGRSISLDLQDRNSRSTISLAPTMEVPVTFSEFFVRFEAGRSSYEIEGRQERGRTTTPNLSPPQTQTITMNIGHIPLTDDQKRCILVLAERALTDPTEAIDNLPTSKQAADRLGWTRKSFDRKLDNVCELLTKKGLPGLHGGQGGVASDRRMRLVEYALTTAIVAKDDLRLLPDS